MMPKTSTSVRSFTPAPPPEPKPKPVKSSGPKFDETSRLSPVKAFLSKSYAKKWAAHELAKADILEYFELLRLTIRQYTALNQMSLTVSHFKGGVGKTPFACNAASELFLSSGRSTLIIDHNQMWGTVARLMGLEGAPCMTIRDVRKFLDQGKLNNAASFSASMGPGQHNVAVLASDRTFELDSFYGEESSYDNIKLAREYYQLVVNDTGNDGQSSAMEGIRKQTTVLAVPTSPDEDGIGIAKSLYDVYSKWGYADLVNRSITCIMGVRPGEELESYRSRLGLSDGRILLGIPYDLRAVKRMPINLDETDIYVRIAYCEAVLAALILQHAHHSDGIDSTFKASCIERAKNIRTGELVELPSGRKPKLPWIDGSPRLISETEGKVR